MPTNAAATDLAGQLVSQKFTAEATNNGRELLAMARDTPDVEAIFVDMDIISPHIREVLYELRMNPDDRRSSNRDPGRRWPARSRQATGRRTPARDRRAASPLRRSPGQCHEAIGRAGRSRRGSRQRARGSSRPKPKPGSPNSSPAPARSTSSAAWLASRPPRRIATHRKTCPSHEPNAEQQWPTG